jgi:hypothetical protein
MRSCFRRLTTIVAAAASAVTVLAAPATAEMTSSLTLTLEDTQGGATNSVTLTCDPDGGTHPHFQQACDAMRRANGFPWALKPTGQPCTLNYSPVTAYMRGNWRIMNIAFKTTFSNRCAAAQLSDNVFQF